MNIRLNRISLYEFHQDGLALQPQTGNHDHSKCLWEWLDV